jgi:DtxR family transcriptional regulator, Mn-dependent transcriptional regulator
MLLSIAEENYIKAIYKCDGAAVVISTNVLAGEINTKASSVTDMLKKLKAKKMIIYKPYEGCKLTTSGIQIALHIIRKHRLWETFLYNTLGFAWNEVHVIAEELEHVGHPELINRLDAFLGFPKVDPHGDAIPDKDGIMPATIGTKLSEVNIGTHCTVFAVKSQEKGILEILNHYKISLHSTLEVLTRFDYDESMELRIQNKTICVLPKSITTNILVH